MRNHARGEDQALQRDQHARRPLLQGRHLIRFKEALNFKKAFTENLNELSSCEVLTVMPFHLVNSTRNCDENVKNRCLLAYWTAPLHEPTRAKRVWRDE